MKRFKIRTLLWVILPLLVALLMSAGAAQAASTCKNGEWKIIPGQNPGISSALRSVAAVSQNDVWAVGYYVDQQNHASYGLIEHWNGKQWKVIPSPNPTAAYISLSAVTAISANDVWAVGDYTLTNGVSRTLIEHWNGRQWKIVPSPNAGSNDTTNYLFAVSGSSATNIWAVGETNYIATQTVKTLIEFHD
jgi:hypothetical protein